MGDDFAYDDFCVCILDDFMLVSSGNGKKNLVFFLSLSASLSVLHSISAQLHM